MLERWRQMLAAVMASRFARAVFAVFGLVAAWDTFGSQLMPPSVRERWPTVYDLAAKTTGYFPWGVWVAVGATILIAFVLEYAHRKSGANGSVTVSGGNTFYSPTVTQIPPTPEQIRALPSAPLRKARRTGVAIRNERLTSEDQFPDWLARYQAWREETLKAAAKLSPVLHDLLETLNEMHGYPANATPVNEEHARRLAIMSEILLRIDKYLADLK